MPHVAVYQGSGASSVYSGVHGPDSHLKLSLFVLFLVNPPFGKDIHVDILLKTQPEQNCFGNVTRGVKLIFTKLINLVSLQ